MNNLQRICIAMCLLVTLQQCVTSYPTIGDDIDWYGDESLESPVDPLFEKRKMGWSLCSKIFKWRCGKARVVRG